MKIRNITNIYLFIFLYKSWNTNITKTKIKTKQLVKKLK